MPEWPNFLPSDMLCIKAWLGAWLPGTRHPALDTCIRAIWEGRPGSSWEARGAALLYPRSLPGEPLGSLELVKSGLTEWLPYKVRLKTTSLISHAQIARDLSTLGRAASEISGSVQQWLEVLTCHAHPHVVFLLSKSSNLLTGSSQNMTTDAFSDQRIWHWEATHHTPFHCMVHSSSIFKSFDLLIVLQNKTTDAF